MNVATTLPEATLLTSLGDAKERSEPMREMRVKELVYLGIGESAQHAVLAGA